MERFREALAARERRMEAAWSAMRAEHDELRTSVGVLQQATHGLVAEAARAQATPAPSTVEGPASSALAGPAPSDAGARAPSTAEAMSHTYVGFEDQFRGSSQEIRTRQEDYAQLFAGSRDVLDIGCGRGEFLDAAARARRQRTRHRPEPVDGGCVPLARARRHH